MSAALGHVLVVGLGSSGRAAAKYCAARLDDGVDSVLAVDSASGERQQAVAEELRALGVTVKLGVQQVDGEYDLAIVSPGIPPHASLAASARACARESISEIEFAYRRSTSPWVAVTGTNGKTTTTALVTHLLEWGGIDATAVGNIGTPAIEVVERSGPGQVLVAEVSSFQLALTSSFHPRVAVLLNITPDHLDWHGSEAAYASDKARVFANLGPDDTAVIDVDDPGSAAVVPQVEPRGVHIVRVSRDTAHAHGATVSGGHLVLETAGGPVRLVAVEQLRILGPHNVSNALAASAAAHAMGVAPADIAEGLKTFSPIEHRLEPVAQLDGVEWFNDSKATNPDATLKAIDSFQGRPLILLVGGRNKGNDFEPMAAAASGRVRHVVAFGESADDLARAFRAAGVDVHQASGLLEAVAAASTLSGPGDAVVLSPACASFDEFTSYEHRGSVFKTAVRDMEDGR